MPMVPAVAGVAQPPPMVQGKGLAAPGAETDVVSQPVEQDFVDLVCNPFPGAVELILVYGAAEAFGEGKV